MDINKFVALVQAKFHLDKDTLNDVIAEYKRNEAQEAHEAQLPTHLEPGQRVQVKGEQDTYTITRSAKEPRSVYCSCPAWKYQRINPLVRTCKHCIALLGKDNEEARVNANRAMLMSINETKGTNYKVI